MGEGPVAGVGKVRRVEHGANKWDFASHCAQFCMYIALTSSGIANMRISKAGTPTTTKSATSRLMRRSFMTDLFGRLDEIVWTQGLEEIGSCRRAAEDQDTDCPLPAENRRSSDIV
jgi:hypothetical protein